MQGGIEKDVKEYTEKLRALAGGQITIQEWTRYCGGMFEDLVKELERAPKKKIFLAIEDEK